MVRYRPKQTLQSEEIGRFKIAIATLKDAGFPLEAVVLTHHSGADAFLLQSAVKRSSPAATIFLTTELRQTAAFLAHGPLPQPIVTTAHSHRCEKVAPRLQRTQSTIASQ